MKAEMASEMMRSRSQTESTGKARAEMERRGFDATVGLASAEMLGETSCSGMLLLIIRIPRSAKKVAFGLPDIGSANLAVGRGPYGHG